MTQTVNKQWQAYWWFWGEMTPISTWAPWLVRNLGVKKV
jgi:hypothetical protein